MFGIVTPVAPAQVELAQQLEARGIDAEGKRKEAMVDELLDSMIEQVCARVCVVCVVYACVCACGVRVRACVCVWAYSGRCQDLRGFSSFFLHVAEGISDYTSHIRNKAHKQLLIGLRRRNGRLPIETISSCL